MTSKHTTSERKTAQRTRKTFHLKDLLKIQPLTSAQSAIFDNWQDKSQFLHGSAGTGKSFISLYLALCDVLDKTTSYDKLLIIRSIVPSRDIGFLPGDIDEKIQVYEEPYSSICDDLFSYKKSYENMKLKGIIQFLPTSFLRGSTFDNSVIIVDEAQNMNFGEIHTIMTRVGNNSKIVFCGDIKQCDLDYSSKNDESGWSKFIRVARKMRSFNEVVFTPEDIVRSDFVKEWILTCENMRI